VETLANNQNVTRCSVDGDTAFICVIVIVFADATHLWLYNTSYYLDKTLKRTVFSGIERNLFSYNSRSTMITHVVLLWNIKSREMYMYTTVNISIKLEKDVWFNSCFRCAWLLNTVYIIKMDSTCAFQLDPLHFTTARWGLLIIDIGEIKLTLFAPLKYFPFI